MKKRDSITTRIRRRLFASGRGGPGATEARQPEPQPRKPYRALVWRADHARSGAYYRTTQHDSGLPPRKGVGHG